MRAHETKLFTQYRGWSRGDVHFAGAVFVAALIFTLLATWSAAVFGPRSAHMASHILTMNVVAPLAGGGWGRRRLAKGVCASNRALVAGFTLQIVVFYAWHLPGVVGTGQSHPYFHAAMHLALFASGFLFWAAILSLEDAALWRGVIALTLTGKLACLLGALLLLAPRLIGGDAGAGSVEALDDQRMAGLLMLAACPLCYLVIAVHMAAKWLSDVEAHAARLCPRQFVRPG